MGELKTNEELNIDVSLDNFVEENIAKSNIPVEDLKGTPENASVSTGIIEYKEVDEPCVALTIIGENRLSDAQVFVKRGFRYSIKAFFSAIILTIMNMFM